jgi:hypothetical protein
MKLVSHSMRARRCRVCAPGDVAGVEKEHVCPALAHRLQTGNVRLHFFLKLRQRSQAGVLSLPDLGECADAADAAAVLDRLSPGPDDGRRDDDEAGVSC